jgi:hypothetical protein
MASRRCVDERLATARGAPHSRLDALAAILRSRAEFVPFSDLNLGAKLVIDTENDRIRNLIS